MNKEILNYSYIEHLKYSKDLAQVLPIDHPKRVEAQKALDDIINKLNN